MKIISLFSGAGISDVGFHQAGLECLAQVEIDKTASSVRRRHFPDTEHHQDIHEFNAIRFRGTCDVVAGGFPCQDYSVAGNRAGLAGDKGTLWWEMLRVIREAEPTLVFGENVPGILSADGGRSFRTIVGSLVKLGYSVAWRVLDLQYFGVPQRRRRVFVVGTRLASSSRGSAGVGIFEPNCLPWGFATSGSAGESAGRRIGTLSASGGWKGGGVGNEASMLVPCAVNGQEAVRWLTPLESERMMGLPDGYTEFGATGERIPDTRRGKMLGNGWSVPQARWLAERFVTGVESASC